MTDIIPGDQLRFHCFRRDIDIAEAVEKTKGGQQVGMHSSIALEHLPTGTIVIIGSQRSQHRNRDMAMAAMEFILTHPEFRG